MFRLLWSFGNCFENVYSIFDNILGFGQYHKISKITWNVTLNQMSQVIKRSEHSNKRKRNNYRIVLTVLYKQLWYSDWTTTLSGSTTVHPLKCSKQNTGNGEDISVQGIISTFSSVIQLQKVINTAEEPVGSMKTTIAELALNHLISKCIAVKQDQQQKHPRQVSKAIRLLHTIDSCVNK